MLCGHDMAESIEDAAAAKATCARALVAAEFTPSLPAADVAQFEAEMSQLMTEYGKLSLPDPRSQITST
eukprot:COSAG01_NODE_2079_length_8464_cov_7.812821_3_plen_69_part_00